MINTNDIRFQPSYNPALKAAEFCLSNYFRPGQTPDNALPYSFIDATNIRGCFRVPNFNDIFTIPDDILGNVGFQVYVLSLYKRYELYDWDKRTDNTIAETGHGWKEISVSGYTLSPATASTLGGVKIGSGISVTADGTISVSGGYTLPAATSTVRGGITIGSGITITGDKISIAQASDTVSGLVKVVQNIGTSTIDVISQKGVTDLLFYDTNKSKVQIGNLAQSWGEKTVSIGDSSAADGNSINGVAIGYQANTLSLDGIAIGPRANIEFGSTTNANNSIAIGADSIVKSTDDNNVMSIGNSTLKRKIINAAPGIAADDVAIISQIPTSLPANGGNADTVDGKHASDFVSKETGTNKVLNLTTGTQITNGRIDYKIVNSILYFDGFVFFDHSLGATLYAGIMPNVPILSNGLKVVGFSSLNINNAAIWFEPNGNIVIDKPDTTSIDTPGYSFSGCYPV